MHDGFGQCCPTRGVLEGQLCGSVSSVPVGCGNGGGLDGLAMRPAIRVTLSGLSHHSAPMSSGPCSTPATDSQARLDDRASCGRPALSVQITRTNGEAVRLEGQFGEVLLCPVTSQGDRFRHGERSTGHVV
jgi:hypothetical protein